MSGVLEADRLWTRILTPDERLRLGNDFESAYQEYGGTTGMWRRLRGVSVPQAVLGAGVALNLVELSTAMALLREFGEDPGGGLNRAIASRGLVLAESPRRMWWQGVELEIDWSKRERAWVILDALARESKAGMVLDRMKIDTRPTDLQYLKKAISKIRHLNGFPESLAKVIRTVGRNTYRLDIVPESIRVFERGAGDELNEWLP